MVHGDLLKSIRTEIFVPTMTGAKVRLLPSGEHGETGCIWHAAQHVS